MGIRSNFGTVTTVLGSAVADDGTFTVSYPTGTTQQSFTAGLAGSGHYAILNDNDKWSAGDPGIAVSFGASSITVTNQSGYSWPAGTKVELNFDLVEGNGRIPITIPIFALSGISAADVVTEIRPGIAGKIEYWEFVTGAPVTTAAKAATLNLEIDSTDVTGGTIALTSAAATPLGKVIAGAAITGNNTLTRDSKLSVEASGVTAFSEGSGFLVIYVRPTADDAY